MLKAGMFVYSQQRIWEIVDISSGGLLLTLKEVDSGDEAEISYEELLGGDLIVANDKAELLQRIQRERARQDEQAPPAAAIAPQLVEKAQMIVRVLAEVEEALEQRGEEVALKGQTAVLAEIIESHGISLATYYAWRKRVDKVGGDVRLVAASFQRQKGTRLTPAALHFLDTVIMAYPSLDRAQVYACACSLHGRTNGWWADPAKCTGRVPEDIVQELKNPRIPLQAILENPEKKALLSTVKLVSRSSFYAYYRDLMSRSDAGKNVLDHRYGEGTWDKEMKVFDTFAHKATQPLQFVFADHYLLDVFIVDEATRSKADRLWLTAAIDVYTRSVLGFVLLYEGPCIESIQGGLRECVWPKQGHLSVLGVEGEWPCFGIPNSLFLDNAFAHGSQSLRNLVASLADGGKYTAVDLVERAPYMARHGALIERFFGNLSRKLKSYLHGKGAIASSRPDDVRNAAKEAVLLYQDIYRFVLEEIVRYQNSVHRELNGMTPNQKWYEAMAFTAPNVPPRTRKFERLFLREYHQTRYRGQKGISLFGMHYNSTELANRPAFLNGRKVSYSIRYEPSDISRIAVFEAGRYLCDARPSELRLPDGEYRSISVAERLMAQKLSREWGQTNVGRDWIQFLDRLDETARTRAREKRSINRKNKLVPKGGFERQTPELSPNSEAEARSGYEGYGELMRDAFVKARH